jgi:Flp pilus assembly protein TadG
VRLRRLRHDESGQILPLFVILLASVLFGITALVLDVGHAMVVKRHLQASVDAAALAGAEQLPDGTSAATAAQSYGPDSSVGGKNGVAGATAAAVAIGCLTSDETCLAAKPDAVSVTASASVPTVFAKVLGIDSIEVHASSTAARTEVTKPLDVALVIDHTGSMQGEMTNLQAGVASFLSHLDPKYDRVALIVLPPVVKRTTRWGAQCSLLGTAQDPYPLGSDDSYLLDHLTTDFAALNSDVRCLTAAGTTSYKQALVTARAELEQNGRAGVQQVIIFETDGAANTVPESAYDNLTTGDDGFPTGTARAGSGPGGGSYADDIDRPCGSAVDYAQSIAATTPVYTVGYQTEQDGSDTTCYEAPHLASADGSTRCTDSGRTRHTAVCYSQVRESLSAATALQEIAGEPDRFFDQEDGSKLDETFAAVASQFASPTLVPDSSYRAAAGA